MVKSQRLPYLYFFPVLVLFSIFFIYPFFYSIYISFNHWNLLTGDTYFVGLENYRRLFGDSVFWRSIRNTLRYVMIQMPLSVVLGLLYAMVIESTDRTKALYRMIFFIPVVISISASSLSFFTIFNTMHGPINQFLRIFSITEPNWLNSPRWALRSIMIVGVWQSFGYNVILYMSGLKQIDKQLYEAADLDGASVIQKLTKITLPALSPVTFFVVVITTLFSFQVFATVQIMTQGGPTNSSSVWVYYIWREAFRYLETGTASAAASILFATMLFITFIMVRFVQRKVFYQ